MTPVEMLGLTEFPRIGELPYFLTLGAVRASTGSGCSRRRRRSPRASRRRPPTDVPHAPALLVGVAWETLLDGNVRTLIERDLLLPFLQRQRWFGGKARPTRSARFVDWGVLRRGPQPLFLTIVEVEFDDGGREQYFLPLTICAHADAKGLEERSPHASSRASPARARASCSTPGSTIASRGRCSTRSTARSRCRRSAARVRAVRTRRVRRAPRRRRRRTARSRACPREQSNTSIVYGDRLILKLFRRLQPGINPDFEIGRQLTERAGFTRVPAVAGRVRVRAAWRSSRRTLAMMQQLVESQGDGWTHATRRGAAASTTRSSDASAPQPPEPARLRRR